MQPTRLIAAKTTSTFSESPAIGKRNPPPLLALNPSLTEPISPPDNYMCTQVDSTSGDNINSQYMSDTGLDYSGDYILP